MNIWISVASGFIANNIGNSDFTNFAGDMGFAIILWFEQIIGKPGFFYYLLTLIDFLLLHLIFHFRVKKREKDI